jgi:phospholipid/cholesterol/gamma-HCH transport system substrate-binding protein
MPKLDDKVKVQVGLFVFIGCGLFLLMIFLIGGEKNLFQNDYHLKASFSNISGLRVGAPVELGGLKIGAVSEINFSDQLNDKKIIVRMSLKQEFQDRIRDDSIIELATQGLLGDKMLLISLGSQNSKVLNNGDFISVKETTSISKMMAKGEQTIIKTNELLTQLNDVMKEIREGNGLVHELIYDPQGGELIDNMNELALSLEGTATNFEKITGKINSGKGTIGALINDDSLYLDMKTLLGKANRNKLVKTAIRHTLSTKEEKLIKD